MFFLSKKAANEGHVVHYKEKTLSTMDDAFSLYSKKNPVPLWVVSLNQTIGRGKRGRKWSSRPGNLAISYIFETEFSLQKISILNFVAGLSLLQAVLEIRRKKMCSENIKLKWPNDLLINGKKAAGVLIETQSLTIKKVMVSVGWGINIHYSPSIPNYPTTSLKEDLGDEINAPQLFSLLTENWTTYYRCLITDNGAKRIKQSWLKYAFKLNETIVLRQKNKDIKGIFVGLDDEFQLLLKTKDGLLLPINTGDMYFDDKKIFP